MKVNTIMVRKPINHEHMVKDQLTLISKFGASIEKVEIDSIIEVSNELFEKFKSDMLKEYDFIVGHEDEAFILKVKGTPDNTGFVVSPSGFPYARYVGAIIEKAPMFDCSKCGRSFVGYPAISRINNHSKVCNECATFEALNDFCHQDVIKFCKDVLQPASNLHNIEITVKSPDGFEKVITPCSKSKSRY